VPYVSAGGLAATDIDTSAELDAIVTDDTGSGAIVFANTPTLVTPIVTTSITSSSTSESINLATADTLIFARNDAGSVTFMGADDAGAADTIYDTTGIGQIRVGSGDVTDVIIMSDGATISESDFVIIDDGTIATGEITDDTITMTDIAATLSPANGDLIDFGTNISSATEGLMVPAHATTCASATAEGQVCWEEDANILWIGDGAAAVAVGPGAGAGDALVANPLSQFAATTSLQLLGVMSNETGTGALVFGASPSITTPVLVDFALISGNDAFFYLDDTVSGDGSPEALIRGLTTAADNGGVQLSVESGAAGTRIGMLTIGSTAGASTVVLGGVADGSIPTVGVSTTEAGVMTALGAGVISANRVESGAAFPGDAASGDVFVVTDDSAAGACNSAAGSALSICRYNGAAWVAVGDGGGAETNSLETLTTGILDDEIPIGVAAGNDVLYTAIPDCNTGFSLSYEQDTNAFSCEADAAGAGSAACIYLNAADINCFSGATGCTGESINGTGVSYTTANFVTTADNTGTFNFAVPTGFTGNTASVQIDWTVNDSTCNNEAADDVCFTFDSGSITNDDPWNAPTLDGTANGVNDTCSANGDILSVVRTGYVHGFIDGERGIFSLTRDVAGTPTGCASEDDYDDSNFAKVLGVTICPE